MAPEQPVEALTLHARRDRGRDEDEQRRSQRVQVQAHRHARAREGDRGTGQAQRAGENHHRRLRGIDLASVPQPTGSVAIQPGEVEPGGPNYDYCETYVVVQDNMLVCEDPGQIGVEVASDLVLAALSVREADHGRPDAVLPAEEREGLAVLVVGVGGGFLIVPALVLLGGLPMHRAVATSLVIIALKSYSGFWKYLDVLADQGLALDWPTLGIVTALGIAGSFVGNHFATRLPQQHLRRLFGWFLIVMGIYIFARSLPGLVAS